jgi:HSP20 family protein
MFRSMIPWRERFPVTVPQLEHEMEDLMERFLGERGDWPMTRFAPSINVAENDEAYTVSAELPGLKPEEVNVELNAGCLLISGDKKEESEEKGKTFHRVERRHGEFRRMVQLPTAVNEDKVEAKFENGVLTVIVPKSREAQAKRIAIKS